MSKLNIRAKLVGATCVFVGALTFGTLTPAQGVGTIVNAGTLTGTGAGQITFIGNSGSAGAAVASAPSAPAASAPPASAPVYVGSFLSPRPVLTIAQPSAASPDNRGPDAKWGDPINADLFDADGMHAKLDYYAGSGNGGTETGVGITFSFPN